MHSPIILLSLLICASNVEAAPQNHTAYPRYRTRADACPAMSVVFARGTLENGDLGSVAGPPLKTSLSGKMASAGATMNMMGVAAPEYAADIAGAVSGGSPTGAAAMAEMAQAEMERCPDSMMAMVGYSQGGQVVHKAATMMPDAVKSTKLMAVIFGDPNNGTAVAGVDPKNTMVICHDGDNICEHGPLVKMEHLTYGMDAPMAADWMMERMMDVTGAGMAAKMSVAVHAANATIHATNATIHAANATMSQREKHRRAAENPFAAMATDLQEDFTGLGKAGPLGRRAKGGSGRNATMSKGRRNRRGLFGKPDAEAGDEKPANPLAALGGAKADGDKPANPLAALGEKLGGGAAKPPNPFKAAGTNLQEDFTGLGKAGPLGRRALQKKPAGAKPAKAAKIGKKPAGATKAANSHKKTPGEEVQKDLTHLGFGNTSPVKV